MAATKTATDAPPNPSQPTGAMIPTPAQSTPPREPKPAPLVPLGERGIELQSLEDLYRFAKFCVDNGGAPKGMTPGSAAIAIQAGLERGLSITSGLQFGTVINGKFAWNGQGVLALIQNSPVCKPGTLKHGVDGEGDARKGWCVAHRVGYEEPFRFEFSVKDAKTAKLWTKEGPWTQYPDGQLRWRAVGFMGKFHFSDVLGGFPLEWELRDHPEMTARVVSPPSERPALPAPVDDPLSAFIAGRKPAAEPAIIEAEAVEVVARPDFVVKVQPSPEVEKQEVLASELEREPGGDDDPPFGSHEEADRELAEQEQKQRGLFEGR